MPPPSRHMSDEAAAIAPTNGTARKALSRHHSFHETQAGNFRQLGQPTAMAAAPFIGGYPFDRLHEIMDFVAG